MRFLVEYKFLISDSWTTIIMHISFNNFVANLIVKVRHVYHQIRILLTSEIYFAVLQLNTSPCSIEMHADGVK